MNNDRFITSLNSTSSKQHTLGARQNMKLYKRQFGQ